MKTGQPGSKWALLAGALVSFSAVAQTTVEIEIKDYRFSPAEVTLHVGDTVRWINREKRTSHSVAFPDEGGLESERLFPGETWQRTFPQAGEFPYTCGPHPEMKGKLVVQD